jgi:hypothetical protein
MVEMRRFDHRQIVEQKPLKSPDLSHVSALLLIFVFTKFRYGSLS